MKVSENYEKDGTDVYRKHALYPLMYMYSEAGSPRGDVITVLLVGTELPESLTVTMLREYCRSARRFRMVIEVLLVVLENTGLSPDSNSML